MRVDRLGDLLTSTPVLRALRQAYPQARLDLLASDRNMKAVQANPHLDRLWVLPLKGYWSWPFLAARLRLQTYDWAVDLNPSYSRTSGFFVRATGAGRRVTLRKKKAHRFFSELVEQTPSQHMIDRQLAMARALGAGQASTQDMEFHVGQTVRRRVRKRFTPEERTSRICVFIGNAKKLRVRWPEDKFAELCVRLARETSATVYVLAGPADQALLGAFAGLWSERLRLFEGTSLEEDAAFMEVCSLVVTSSSGPMHLAAAVGTPTVSILGDYTYDCWRPLGEEHRTLHSGLPHGEVRPVSVEDVFRVVQGRFQELREEEQGGSPG
ncbi:MAG: glycosyltransferase family 9 protein [Deferrisomatales bacterium]|nr:glycosyltransferase family 9 protein [Deferrisomatales bacterium]